VRLHQEYDDLPRCPNDHTYQGIHLGYSPHALGGTCRICMRASPLTFPEFVHLTHARPQSLCQELLAKQVRE
jgi:hypothetical protein